jgi:hypothetical protein
MSDGKSTPMSEGAVVDLTGTLSEIKSLVEKPKGGETELIEKEHYVAEKKPYDQYAVVTKQILDEEGKLKKKTVQINSPQLLKALNDVVTYYPSESLDFNSQASFDSPFALLHHHRNELATYKDESTDETTREHIDLLLFFLASEAGDKGKEAEKLIVAGKVSFDNAWMVFKPGDLLFASSYDQDRLYQLQQTGYHEDNCRGNYFELSCGYTSCDGSRTGTAKVCLKLFEKEEWVGKTPADISGLSATPLKFFEEQTQEEVKEKLRLRGEQYLQIKGVQNYLYDGLFLYLKTPPYDYYDERANVSFVLLCKTALLILINSTMVHGYHVPPQKESSSIPKRLWRKCAIKRREFQLPQRRNALTATETPIKVSTQILCCVHHTYTVTPSK